MNRWLADRTCLDPTRIFIQSDLIGKQGRLVVPPSMFGQLVEPFVAPQGVAILLSIAVGPSAQLLIPSSWHDHELWVQETSRAPTHSYSALYAP